MPNKDVIEKLEFCLYRGRCAECSLGEEKAMLSCRTLLEDCRTALKNPVEVVRCKDCKYYVVQRLECRYPRHNGIIGIDGFCSYGERKE